MGSTEANRTYAISQLVGQWTHIRCFSKLAEMFWENLSSYSGRVPNPNTDPNPTQGELAEGRVMEILVHPATQPQDEGYHGESSI